MPSPFPRYDAAVPKNCCQIQYCEVGRTKSGKLSIDPSASKVVKREAVFSYDSDFTFGLLDSVFNGLGRGADYERLSDQTQKLWCKILDKCDLEAIDFNLCDDYVHELVVLCDTITSECTDRGFVEWNVAEDAYEELTRAWRHFVRLIWMRDLEWEDTIRCISDIWANEAAEYYTPDPAAVVRHVVSSKLIVPLQVWGFLLNAAAEIENNNTR